MDPELELIQPAVTGYEPLSDLYCSRMVISFLASSIRWESLARARLGRKLANPTVARIPIIDITTRISISVNPRRVDMGKRIL